MFFLHACKVFVFIKTSMKFKIEVRYFAFLRFFNMFNVFFGLRHITVCFLLFLFHGSEKSHNNHLYFFIGVFYILYICLNVVTVDNVCYTRSFLFEGFANIGTLLVYCDNWDLWLSILLCSMKKERRKRKKFLAIFFAACLFLVDDLLGTAK